MKKNLFGAVAAGLALALAITSFGCESGNDSPLAQPYERKTANYKIDIGKKFKDTVYEYKAAPTIYESFATTYVSNSTSGTGASFVTENTDKVSSTSVTTYQNGSILASEAVTDLNYSWAKYVDGIQSYNKLDGKWSGTAAKGTNIGDVTKTAYETFTIDTSDNTFKWSKKSSNYEVRGLRIYDSVEWGDNYVYNTPHTYFEKKLTQTTAYDTLPYYILPEANRKTYPSGNLTIKYALTEFQTNNTAGGDYPYLTIGRATSHADARLVIDAAIIKAQNALDNAKITDLTTTASGRSAAVKAAEEDLAKLQNLKKQSDYYERGARVSILDTETVDEKTTGYLKYYTKVGGTLIDTEDKAATNNKNQAMTGKFTITGDSYIDGAEIVLTEITDYRNNEKGDKYVFTDGSDYYYKNDVYGKVSVDFPVATAYTSNGGNKGSVWQKAARTLKINNKVLTATAVDTNYTNHTAKDSVLTTSYGAWGVYGYFLSSSHDSFDNYKLYYQRWTSNTTQVDTPASYKYTYVEKN